MLGSPTGRAALAGITHAHKHAHAGAQCMRHQTGSALRPMSLCQISKKIAVLLRTANVLRACDRWGQLCPLAQPACARRSCMPEPLLGRGQGV
jgi:hypothetical protein